MEKNYLSMQFVCCVMFYLVHPNEDDLFYHGKPDNTKKKFLSLDVLPRKFLLCIKKAFIPTPSEEFIPQLSIEESKPAVVNNHTSRCLGERNPLLIIVPCYI